VPRQIAALEDNEAEGFSVFGKRAGKRAPAVSKKSDGKCKIDKNGKLPKDCKVRALTVTIN